MKTTALRVKAVGTSFSEVEALAQFAITLISCNDSRSFVFGGTCVKVAAC